MFDMTLKSDEIKKHTSTYLHLHQAESLHFLFQILSNHKGTNIFEWEG